jgi:hypothetical protein
MAAPGGAKVVGAAQLRRTLKAAGADLKDMTKVHRDVGQVILPEAKRLAPLGPPQNGHIRDSIRVGATRRATIIRAGNKRQPYGPVRHWGWHRRGIRPNPWISRAAQATESRWVQVYFAGVEAIVRKIEGK